MHQALHKMPAELALDVGLDFARQVAGGDIAAHPWTRAAAHRFQHDLAAASKPDSVWTFDRTRALRPLAIAADMRPLLDVLDLTPWRARVVAATFGFVARDKAEGRGHHPGPPRRQVEDIEQRSHVGGDGERPQGAGAVERPHAVGLRCSGEVMLEAMRGRPRPGVRRDVAAGHLSREVEADIEREFSRHLVKGLVHGVEPRLLLPWGGTRRSGSTAKP